MPKLICKCGETVADWPGGMKAAPNDGKVLVGRNFLCPACNQTVMSVLDGTLVDAGRLIPHKSLNKDGEPTGDGDNIVTSDGGANRIVCECGRPVVRTHGTIYVRFTKDPSPARDTRCCTCGRVILASLDDMAVEAFIQTKLARWA